jgi:hypothetical protein
MLEQKEAELREEKEKTTNLIKLLEEDLKVVLGDLDGLQNRINEQIRVGIEGKETKLSLKFEAQVQTGILASPEAKLLEEEWGQVQLLKQSLDKQISDFRCDGAVVDEDGAGRNNKGL